MSFSKSTLTGHLAAAGTYIIFGLNILFTKDLTRTIGLSPIAIFTERAIGAMVLFWLLSLFTTKEKVERRDLPRIAIASLIGFFTVQLLFLLAVSRTTAVDIAIIGTLTPVFTMFFAAFFLKEPITLKKAGGVAVSLAGVIFLILSSTVATGGVEHSTALGFILIFGNVAGFAAYLGIFKPLAAKYHPVTYMKWIFLFAFIYGIPFSAGELVRFDFGAMSGREVFELWYLVFMATFIAYFLLPIAQKRIRPTLISMYTYLQPIITAVIGIAAGTDVLSWKKVLAVIFIFGGVTLVNASRKA